MKSSEILQGKLQTEFKTVASMMEIYCRSHHDSSKGLCAACNDLLIYAEQRLDRCPYGQEKPTCNQCPIHCYKSEPKEQMRLVMRYSGPRMLLPHPILAIRHLLHERKPVPSKPSNMTNRKARMNK
ncbi:nitrous oxide-stimulated promoter family protein [Vibrio mexicanus]|uniref:nitrous oxide-stimulated promoter family protein n=1 Tax=Vibrio mexicanus TaxID=1004326 RepID=UPI000949843D|nr:nitrous oxide-stimulated promoter family protein [Vibrio mexicanus]